MWVLWIMHEQNPSNSRYLHYMQTWIRKQHRFINFYVFICTIHNPKPLKVLDCQDVMILHGLTLSHPGTALRRALYIVTYLPPHSTGIFIINCIFAPILKGGYTQYRKGIPMCFIWGIPGTEWAGQRSGEMVKTHRKYKVMSPGQWPRSGLAQQGWDPGPGPGDMTMYSQCV